MKDIVPESHLLLRKLSAGLAGALAGGLLLTALSTGANSGEVTFSRLLNAEKEPQNWITNNHSYNSNRHSRLKQINRDNVGGLGLAFAVALGGFEGGGRFPNGSLEATPLVDNGLMYVTDSWGSVYKIDVRTGRKGHILWKMDPGSDRSLPTGILANRGVALYKNSALSVTLDGRLISTNLDSGEIQWEKQFAFNERQEYLTVAPLIVKDMVVFGSSGADNGARGWILAADAATGEEIWRRYIVPEPGQPGSETWKDDWNAWETGGGSAWVTGSYDPDQNLIIWGTGNPAPDFDNAYRPGDNLFTNSALGLDADTGEIRWFFQYTPNDPWDYDEIGTHLLFEAEINGQVRKLVGHSGRNGFYYTLDRTNGEFVSGSAYLQSVTWATGLDPKTGKPLEYDPNLDVQVYVPGTAPSRNNLVGISCPMIGGGNNFYPSAYNPDEGLFYIVGTENCSRIDQTDYIFEKGEYALGGNVGFGGIRTTDKPRGSLSAVDIVTGQVKEQITLTFPSVSGILSTAGGVIFSATLDGTVSAYHNQTLEQLWSMNLGTGFSAPPMTYAVDGKQYVAILAGSSRISAGHGRGIPELANVNPTHMLFVFAL